jgi:hypothetical protein
MKPDTIVKWHRAGFRLFWRHRSQADARSEPKLTPDLISLIRQMAASSSTRGAERIRGELLNSGGLPRRSVLRLAFARSVQKQRATARFGLCEVCSW